jgi:hypothetical protein
MIVQNPLLVTKRPCPLRRAWTQMGATADFQTSLHCTRRETNRATFGMGRISGVGLEPWPRGRVRAVETGKESVEK